MESDETKKQEEFELIPVTPLRRLEKRIEELEKKASINERELYREIIQIVRMNQEIVDALIKANDSLRIELSKLPLKLEELTKKIDELIELIKAAGEEETESKVSVDNKPLIEKIEKLTEINNKILENNEALISLLEEISKKLTKPLPPIPPKPPIASKPPFTQ
jgi:ferric iron reductase protein FhuF